MIPIAMARSHRPRAPRRRSSWEPVPLHLPLDRPSRAPGPPAQKNRYPTHGELDHESEPAGDADDTVGSHVIVIDLA